MNSPLLSLLVVSYNQPEKLRRCLNSIVTLDIPFEFEVIVSDDHSTDSTFDVSLEFASKYSFIHPVHNQYAQGIGWNRCNAYNNASGKYFASVDGDDYIIAESSHYRHQVEQLEAHPECSCCLSRIYIVKEGEIIIPGETPTRIEDVLFSTGECTPPQNYIENIPFTEHQAFVFRRQPDLSPQSFFGRRFDDIYIQSYFMQRGDIVFLDEAGYVYVQYPNSDSHRPNDDPDKYIRGCFAITLPYYCPQLTDSFTITHLGGVKKVLKLAILGHKMSECSYEDVKHFDAWIFDVLHRGPSLIERFSCCFRWLYIKIIRKHGFYSPLCLRIARRCYQ